MDKPFTSTNLRSALIYAIAGTLVFALLAGSLLFGFREKLGLDIGDLAFLLGISSLVIFLSITAWAFLEHQEVPSRLVLPLVFLVSLASCFRLISTVGNENVALLFGLGILLPLIGFALLQRLQKILPLPTPGDRYLQQREILLLGITYQICRENKFPVGLNLPFGEAVQSETFETYRTRFAPYKGQLRTILTAGNLPADEYLVALSPTTILTNRHLFIFSGNHIHKIVDLPTLRFYHQGKVRRGYKGHFTRTFHRVYFEWTDGKSFMVDGLEGFPEGEQIRLLAPDLQPYQDVQGQFAG
ncbi:MAG TPA: hypothetical protein PKV71_11935 [Calditrichia bacterium]|nr:hypothetical protein [Calditrichota bacterium]HQU74826.1 hypothetical protein [Calditrichia bacterium]HQV32583.1 hypothetical protein [Calditrichia bacterium]